MSEYDVIIVGTGPAGVHAAWPLAQAGKNILLIDGGYAAPKILSRASIGNFEDVRMHDIDQWKLFLGEDFSSIPLSGLHGGLGGGQTTGNRSYVVEGTSKFLPLTTDAQILQSLAQGGLGAVWGAAGAFLSASELRSMGLSEDIQKEYDVIARRIGISGPPTRTSVQPPLRLDQHGRAMLDRYKKKENTFLKMDISVLQPPSAVLTQDLGERKKTQYDDMEYWTDRRKSVYRPQYSLEELRKLSNVRYEGGYVVRTIQEGRAVEVMAESVAEGTTKTWSGKRVILAAGAVNSGRILLQSRDMEGEALPFIGKPHVFIPCLRLGALGQAGDRERCSLCQLIVVEQRLREGLASSCAQLYSYRSMLLFRLIGSVPLPVPMALHAVRILAPCLVIADVRFPGFRSTGSMHLQHGTLCVTVNDASQQEAHVHSIALQRRALRALGLRTLPTMLLPPGSTSHYGGSIPIGKKGEFPLTVDSECRLHGSEGIYVADASVFRALPANPHTFTIMANANRVGEAVLSKL